MLLNFILCCSMLSLFLSLYVPWAVKIFSYVGRLQVSIIIMSWWWSAILLTVCPKTFTVALRPQRPCGLLGTGSPGRPPLLSHSSWVLTLCFTSTLGLLGTVSPGRPPRLSHSSWALTRKRLVPATLGIGTRYPHSPAFLINRQKKSLYGRSEARII